jgi:hypothetical protein
MMRQTRRNLTQGREDSSSTCAPPVSSVTGWFSRGAFIGGGKLDKGCVVVYCTLTASADLSIFGGVILKQPRTQAYRVPTNTLLYWCEPQFAYVSGVYIALTPL